MVSTGERYGALEFFPSSFHLINLGFELIRLGLKLQICILIGNRNSLAIRVEASQDVHGDLYIPLGNLAGTQQVRHGSQNMSAIKTAFFATQLQIISDTSPRSLFLHLGVFQPVLLK